jgi:hypothetical protein
MRIIIVPRGVMSSNSGKYYYPVSSRYLVSSVEFQNRDPVVILGRKYNYFRINTTLGRLVDNGLL